MAGSVTAFVNMPSKKAAIGGTTTWAVLLSLSAHEKNLCRIAAGSSPTVSWTTARRASRDLTVPMLMSRGPMHIVTHVGGAAKVVQASPETEASSNSRYTTSYRSAVAGVLPNLALGDQERRASAPRADGLPLRSRPPPALTQPACNRAVGSARTITFLVQPPRLVRRQLLAVVAGQFDALRPRSGVYRWTRRPTAGHRVERPNCCRGLSAR
jgi:hypothetical protein